MFDDVFSYSAIFIYFDYVRGINILYESSIIVEMSISEVSSQEKNTVSIDLLKPVNLIENWIPL